MLKRETYVDEDDDDCVNEDEHCHCSRCDSKSPCGKDAVVLCQDAEFDQPYCEWVDELVGVPVLKGWKEDCWYVEVSHVTTRRGLLARPCEEYWR
jgi:hypothetical protein